MSGSRQQRAISQAEHQLAARRRLAIKRPYPVVKHFAVR
jgi:hypothetical protein